MATVTVTTKLTGALVAAPVIYCAQPVAVSEAPIDTPPVPKLILTGEDEPPVVHAPLML